MPKINLERRMAYFAAIENKLPTERIADIDDRCGIDPRLGWRWRKQHGIKVAPTKKENIRKQKDIRKSEDLTPDVLLKRVRCHGCYNMRPLADFVQPRENGTSHVRRVCENCTRDWKRKREKIETEEFRDQVQGNVLEARTCWSCSRKLPLGDFVRLSPHKALKPSAPMEYKNCIDCATARKRHYEMKRELLREERMLEARQGKLPDMRTCSSCRKERPIHNFIRSTGSKLPRDYKTCNECCSKQLRQRLARSQKVEPPATRPQRRMDNPLVRMSIHPHQRLLNRPVKLKPLCDPERWASYKGLPYWKRTAKSPSPYNEPTSCEDLDPSWPWMRPRHFPPNHFSFGLGFVFRNARRLVPKC